MKVVNKVFLLVCIFFSLEVCAAECAKIRFQNKEGSIEECKISCLDEGFSPKDNQILSVEVRERAIGAGTWCFEMITINEWVRIHCYKANLYDVICPLVKFCVAQTYLEGVKIGRLEFEKNSEINRWPEIKLKRSSIREIFFAGLRPDEPQPIVYTYGSNEIGENMPCRFESLQEK